MSSKKTSTPRPKTPPFSSTSFWTSLQVLCTWLPYSAYVPVITVGMPILIGVSPRASRRMVGDPRTTAGAAPAFKAVRRLNV